MIEILKNNSVTILKNFTNKVQAMLHTYKKEIGGVALSRKQILNCTNKFQSKDEKERSQNYTQKWIYIINQIEANKVDRKCKNKF